MDTSLSLGQALMDSARRRAAALALRFDASDWTYGDLAARAAVLAGTLRDQGVQPGDRVALGWPNSPELVIGVLAVLSAGAVLVPLNPAYTPEELVYIVGDAGVSVALVHHEHAAILRTAGLPALRAVFAQVVSASVAADVAPRDPGDAALIVYTSGTTGRPKGAVLSHRALLSNLLTVAEAWRWSERDRLLLALPCFHLHGLGLGIICSLLVGSSIVLRRRFHAEDIGPDLARNDATMFFGVPTMYNRLLALPADQLVRADLAAVRLWVSGSAPLTAATFEQFHARIGASILERYGMTECGFVLATPYDGPRRPGVVGVPLPGITIRLVDPEAADRGDLVDVADGVPGEIVIRGPNLFSGYWNRPDDTARTMLHGFLRSGDIARREADGMYRVLGRSSVDIIKTRGFKVGAVEIEDCLQRHAAVQEVAVVGLPDADQGERVVAAVTLRPGHSADAAVLTAFARQHLAPHKVPAAIVFIDEIPRIGPGKFKKKELIRLLAC